MNKKQLLIIASVAFLSSLLSIFIYGKTFHSNSFNGSYQGQIPANYTSFMQQQGGKNAPVDFAFAAKASIDAVVHINIKVKEKIIEQQPQQRGNRKRQMPQESPFDDFFEDFFEGNPFGGGGGGKQVIPEQKAAGSGVLISEDGYIVTNNHVVEKADEIKVTFSNKKSYTAKVIGKDPSSDLAVLKIEGSKFPFLIYGNSDEAEIGQWVLAIGYPLYLDVTVTAGIISAKARSLGINAQAAGNLSSVESFIQTDAAVNKGNSGGALVNTKGELIGINSAIASPTGYYSGYSYAIPVNIAKKIVADIIKFGTVQRAYLGISYPSQENVSEEQVKKYDYKQGEGVLVVDVATDGAAKEAGMKEGDVIVRINDAKVVTGAELIEQIARFHPGDKVKITYKRAGKEVETAVILRAKSGSYASIKFNSLGVELEALTKKEAEDFRVKGGIKVKAIQDGKIQNQTRIRKGFVITKIERKEITTVEYLKELLNGLEGRIEIEGFYPEYDGKFFYEIDLDDKSDDKEKNR